MTFDEQREYMDKNVYWLRKFYRVFNCSLMDGVPAKEMPMIDVNDRIEKAEAILDYWNANESKIVYGGSQAFYRPSTDEVHLPEREKFKSTQSFYDTAFHDIGWVRQSKLCDGRTPGRDCFYLYGAGSRNRAERR